MVEKLFVIGVASGIAAGDVGCGDGPKVLQQSVYAPAADYIHWQAMIEPAAQVNLTKPQIIADVCQRIAVQTENLAANKATFCVFGGDHSCAIGTWSGAAHAYRDQGAIGLIWVDAHLDSHTPETSESGNIHGMPVATLLGYGAQALTEILQREPKIAPENLCLIGIRSYESGEYELLKRLGVKIFYMEDIEKNGFAMVFSEALMHVQKNTVAFGVSIDLDAIDPIEAPGVGSPEKNGISAVELNNAIKILASMPNFIGFEITEFNPHHDVAQQTEKLAWELAMTMAGKTNN